MLRDQKIEQKQEPKRTPSTAIMPLREDAFVRPPERVETKDIEKSLGTRLYNGKTPVYTFNDEYKEQINKLTAELRKIAEKHKFPFDILEKIKKFPKHLFDMPVNGTPFKEIKLEMERYILLLQHTISTEGETIRQKFAEKKIDLTEPELEAQIDIERKKAEKYEKVQLVTLNIILPEINVCNTGMAGNFRSMNAMLTGGDTLEDAWCDTRSYIVNKFIARHKDIYPDIQEKDGSNTHVDNVINTHAYQKGWGLRNEINLKDPFEKLTRVTPLILRILDNDFADQDNLRLRADRFAPHFQKLFWEKYPYKVEEKKGESQNWLPKTEASFCADEILKQWKIKEDELPSSLLFAKKYDAAFNKKTDEEKKAIDQSAEEKEPNAYSLLPALQLKQLFLKFCQAHDHYVNQDQWVAEPSVFQDPQFRLMHAKSPAFADLYWIERRTEAVFSGKTLEGEEFTHTNVEETVISFTDLPPAEQMHFRIYETVNFGNPGWLTPPSLDFFEVFKTEEDITVLANELAKQNDYERHTMLLKSLLEKAPDILTTILIAAHKNNNAEKILEVVNMSYQWTHKNVESFLNNKVLATDSSLQQMLSKKMQEDKEKIAAFQKKYVSPETKETTHKLPIPFSILIKNADKATTAEDQFVYRLYLYLHYKNEYQKLPPDGNAAKAFKAKYETEVATLDALQKQWYLYIKDGKVDLLKKFNIKLENILKFQLPNTFIPAESREYLFALATQYYETGRDPMGTPLLAWAAQFNKNKMESLLKLATLDTINQKDKDGYTALHRATIDNNLEAANVLIKKGANIHLTESRSVNAFLWAVIASNLEIAQLLLDHGADVNSVDNDGESALGIAIHNNHYAMVRLLLLHNARVNTLRETRKPLMMAAVTGNIPTTRLLMEYGADVNIINDTGQTPLHAAAYAGHLELVRMLLAAGADPAIYEGKSAADIAKTEFIRQIICAAEFKQQKLVKKPLADDNKYFLVEPFPPQWRKGAWQGWLEDADGNVVSFEKLSQQEQMQYHIRCMVEFLFPDHLNFVKPAPTFATLFTTDESLQKLSTALADENNFEKHRVFFQRTFKNHPERLSKMLQVMNVDQVLEILDILNIDLYWLHDTTPEHAGAMQILTDLMEQPRLSEAIIQRYAKIKKELDDMQDEMKLNIVPPIPYSKLVEFAPNAKPQHQAIYHMYLKAHYPAELEDKNAALAFENAHKREVIRLAKLKEPIPEKLMTSLRDGNVKEFENRFLSDFWNSQISSLPFQPNHLYQPMYDYFYDYSRKQTQNLLVHAVALHQKDPLISVLHQHIVPIYESQSTLNGYDALSFAADVGREDFVELLLANGFDINLTSVFIGFMDLLQHQKKSTVPLLLERGINLNRSITADGESTYPLTYVARQGALDLAHMLLEKGANVNVAFDKANNPLFCAVTHSNTGTDSERAKYFELIRLFLDRGANVNGYKDPAFTPLVCAIEQQNIQMIELLLKYGADPNLNNAMQAAIRTRQAGIVSLLLNENLPKRADPNAVIDAQGTTLLHLAATMNDPGVVAVLLKNGADPTRIVDPKIREPLLVKPVVVMTVGGYEFQLLKTPDNTEKMTIESKSSGPILFHDLPPEVKNEYYIKSMALCSLPDRYHLTNPPIKTGEIFNNRELVQQLAKALEETNLENHVSFFRTFFKENAGWFAEMVSNMKPENMMKVLDLAQMDLNLMLKNRSATIVRDLLLQSKNKNVFNKHIIEVAEAHNKFNAKFKAEWRKIPPLYSALVAQAYEMKSSPEMQLLYSIYSPYYFSEKFVSGDRLDCIQRFKYMHEWITKKETSDAWLQLLDGTLPLSKLDVFIVPENLQESMKLNHDPVISQYFYQEALKKHPKLKWALAARFNQLKELSEIKDSEINVAVGAEATPLHVAAVSGHLECIRFLIGRKANLEKSWDGGLKVTPLYGALTHHKNEAARLLIEAGANVNFPAHTTLLIATTFHGNAAGVRLLCSHGANVDAYANGTTALTTAATDGYIEIVQILLAAGANPTPRGYSLYSTAKTPEIKRLLLIAELEQAIKAETSVAQTHGRFFAAANVDERLNALLTSLKGSTLKADLEKHHADFAAVCSEQPLKDIFERVQHLAKEMKVGVALRRS